MISDRDFHPRDRKDGRLLPSREVHMTGSPDSAAQTTAEARKKSRWRELAILGLALAIAIAVGVFGPDRRALRGAASTTTTDAPQAQ
jgi:hypothetical protein